MSALKVIHFVVLIVLACPACFSFEGRIPAELELTKNIVPENIVDALTMLDGMIDEDIKRKIKGGEIAPSDLHFSLGMRLRNIWGLWSGSRLAGYFNKIGIEDPDAMSAIILETYYRKLSGRPLEIEEQVARHKAYWDSKKWLRDKRAKIEKEAELLREAEKKSAK